MKRLLLYPLRIMIPVLLLLVTAAWSAYTLYQDTHREDMRIETVGQDRLIQDMTEMQRLLEYLVGTGGMAAAAIEIAPAGSNTGLIHALLVDEHDIVRQATRRAWIGLPVQQVLPDFPVAVVARARDTLAGEVMLAEDRDSVEGYYPVVLDTQADELRPSRTGILHMRYDLRERKQDGRYRVQAHVWASTLFMAGLAVLLWIFSHFVVTRRVARIVNAAERLAAGDRTAQTGLRGQDELGRIGQAFDQMARKIEADNARLIESTLLLEYQALHDSLTNLPNRALLEDRLQQAIHTSTRDSKPFALLVMDLDRFKEVNDSLGHQYGDQLLQQVAMRLQTTLRKSDTVARLGGDEFAVLLIGAEGEHAIQTARVLANALAVEFQLQGRVLEMHASIGIALFPEHGVDDVTLLRRADVAMYVAKRANSNYALYDREQDQDSLRQLMLSGELSRAVEGQQLLLHYQAKVFFNTGQVVGAEALVRWNHPHRGLIPPDEFIPLAERTGLIRDLTQFVLREAIRQCAEWRRAGLEIALAVNLSARDLQEAQLAEQVASYLAEYNVPATSLEIEITESVIMTDPARALAVLTQLSDRGVNLSIDDFGTGYSSLAYLKKLPVDTLKIDKSFVMNMVQDESDAAIVHSTIDLAHHLGLKVVAEGVETQEVWDMLADLGCDIAQGYFLGRPQAAADFSAWLGQSPLTSRRAQRSPQQMRR